MGYLLGVEQGKEDAGEDGGEEQGGGGEGGGGLPSEVGFWGAGQSEPVVCDSEGGEEEAAEAGLLEDGGDDGAEEGDEPRGGGVGEELVDGDGFGLTDEVGDELHDDAEDKAEGKQAKQVEAGDGPVPADAFEVGTVPKEGEEEPGSGQGDGVDCGHHR